MGTIEISENADNFLLRYLVRDQNNTDKKINQLLSQLLSPADYKKIADLRAHETFVHKEIVRVEQIIAKKHKSILGSVGYANADQTGE